MRLFTKNCGKYITVFILALIYNVLICEAISNASFSGSIRDYSANDTANLTHVKTLQNEESGKNFYILPPDKQFKFKETHDSDISSSSNSRGLLIHDHLDYNLNDYEEAPHFEYGHGYQHYDHHSNPHGPHGYGHYGYEPHYYVGHHHYDKGHYKHDKHALATKAVLWPLAGIALLGAAAALVTNPVLLQLGVISGKRRRRDTEEISGPDLTFDAYNNYKEKYNHRTNNKIKADMRDMDQLRRRFKKMNNATTISAIKYNSKRKVVGSRLLTELTAQKGDVLDVAPLGDLKKYPPNRDSDFKDTFIPIPIMLRSPMLNKK